VNVDLCFVPATHEVANKLPAVSGSSGRLIVERPQSETTEREWPGCVFEDPALAYEEAMLGFVAASQERAHPSEPESKAEQADKGSLKAEKRALRREETQLRDERRQIREKRKLEDAAWREARAARKAVEQAYQALSKEERRQQRKAKQTRDEQWRAWRAQRRVTLEERKREDEEWRQKRRSLRERWSQLPVVTAWIAILVILDNCTRQCLGLPLFVAGPKVTSEMVVEALQVLLPPELRFLITDRGTHFTANAFKKLVLSEEFIHVLIARHRPQSNSIAERFVRTLKEWLEDKSWRDDQELAVLLQQSLDEYNDRPHQGLAIPGLSPNEFAKRIWLM
jgi:transposase InsO family protein